MVDWTLENVPIPSHPQILEIGSGNGTLLFALRDAGYAAPHLSGIDYSPDAVRLARMVAQTRNSEQITFHVCDFLSEPAPPPAAAVSGGQSLDDLEGSWDLLLDKGTYDAIALGEKDGSGSSPVAAYPVRASKLLRENGYLLITCKPRDGSDSSLVTIGRSLQFYRR
jgi:SAM-dependent methyltransferase